MSAAPYMIRTKSPGSVQHRENLVRQRAWWLFLEREPARKQFDWQEAIGQCGLVGVFVDTAHPQRLEVVAKAEENWLRRKDRNAQEDWFNAEARIDQDYKFN